MRKRNLAIVLALMFLVACAHAPTMSEKVLGIGQTVNAIVNEVAKAAPVFIGTLEDPHLYNQAAKAYNDFLAVAKQYNNIIKAAEKYDKAPPLATIAKITQEVFNFIDTLKSMGVNVDKLNEIALGLYGGKDGN